jgi:hypothetical protein
MLRLVVSGMRCLIEFDGRFERCTRDNGSVEDVREVRESVLVNLEVEMGYDLTPHAKIPSHSQGTASSIPMGVCIRFFSGSFLIGTFHGRTSQLKS